MFKFIRSFKKNYPTWDDFMATVHFYKFNPHSIPGIAQLLCKLGRHDYEAYSITLPNRVTLECFYCGKKKGSQC